MLQLSSDNPTQCRTEALVIPVFENGPATGLPVLDELIAGALDLNEFSGSEGQILIWYRQAGVAAERIVFAGMGKPDDLTVENVRKTAGKMVKQAMQMKLSRLAFYAGLPASDTLNTGRLLEGLMEGACLANHIFTPYKKDEERRCLDDILVLVSAEQLEAHRQLPAQIDHRCRMVIRAREWVNLPANDKKPADLANDITALAERAGLQTRILGPEQLRKEHFGALLAVNAGSAHEPRLVVLDHRPENAAKTVVLIGKGVTFDSGGLNIKTTKTLNMMKIDMAGAAAVAATLLAVAGKPTGMRVVGILPLVENMVSGTATRPGDIIRMHSGKTVEIGNTDAEGRLILADAISYAIQAFKPDAVIDIATLTGACAIAMGERLAAVFSPDDALVEAIVQAGQETFERCWRMPLPEDYREYLKSDLADLNNMSSSRYGGAITAALFLSSFVDGKAPWAHIDIAGPAYHKNGGDYQSGGGTGFGVRLLCRVLEKLQ